MLGFELVIGCNHHSNILPSDIPLTTSVSGQICNLRAKVQQLKCTLRSIFLYVSSLFFFFWSYSQFLPPLVSYKLYLFQLHDLMKWIWSVRQGKNWLFYHYYSFYAQSAHFLPPIQLSLLTFQLLFGSVKLALLILANAQ